MKVAGTVALQPCTPHLIEKFGDVQQGVNRILGCERVAHQVNESVQAGHTTITIDSTNAYNALHRSVIAEELHKDPKLQPMWKLFHFSYGEPSELHVEGMNSIIMSDDGTRQGDPPAGALFCIAIHPILMRTIERFPDLKLVRAIIDDITITGPTAVCLAAFDFMSEELAKVGLKVNSKSEIYLAAGETMPDSHAHQLREVKDGIKIVGVYISRESSHVETWLASRTTKDEKFFRRVSQLPPQQGVPVLQKCGVPRWNYAIRTHEPAATAASSAIFDGKVLEALALHAGAPLETWSDESKKLAHLPESDGGCGFTRTSLIRNAAYQASRDASLNDHTPTPTQTTATSMLNKAIAAEVDEMGPIEKAHRRAGCAKGSLQWAHMVNQRFPTAEFKAALRWRLGIAEPYVKEINTCDGCGCVQEKRSFQEHRPGCARIKRFNASTTHTAVKKSLQRLSSIARVGYWNEPRYEGYVPPIDNGEDAHQQGPDTTFYLPCTLVVDVKGINSACASHCQRSLKSVMDQKTNAATTLYGPLCTAAGETFRVVCFEYMGGLSPELLKLVRRLCEENRDTIDYEEELGLLRTAMMRSVGRILLRPNRM